MGLPIPAKGSLFIFEEQPTSDSTVNSRDKPATKAATERRTLLIFHPPGLLAVLSHLSPSDRRTVKER
jgi:hypothetical protein